MPKQFPLITAHTGCMNTPDNSALSIETGLKLGADVVEDDIRVTLDGVPVLAHDDMIQTAGGKECRISEMNFSELQELQIVERGHVFPICSLEQMLALTKQAGKIANLDLKVDESIESVGLLVRKYGMWEQVILSGCQADRAAKVQQLYPDLRKLLNADAHLFLSMEYADAVEKTCADAIRTACIGINIDYRLVRPELLDTAASKMLPVLVWTVNEEELMKRFVELGVYSITTRNVSALLKLKQDF